MRIPRALLIFAETTQEVNASARPDCKTLHSTPALLSLYFHCSLLNTMATPKDDVAHLEKAPEATPETSSDNVEEALDDDPVYTRAEQRKIIHRVDRRLISVAGIIYMNSLMDRSNLPNAMIAGMDVDLGLRGNSRYVSMKTAFAALVLLSAEANPLLSLSLPWCSSSRTHSSSLPPRFSHGSLVRGFSCRPSVWPGESS